MVEKEPIFDDFDYKVLAILKSKTPKRIHAPESINKGRFDIIGSDGELIDLLGDADKRIEAAKGRLRIIP